MVEIIASDFEVDIVSQTDEDYFLSKEKAAFFHFVFFQKKEFYNDINQFYIHRFEIANWLYSIKSNFEAEKTIHLASNNVKLTFSSDAEIVKVEYGKLDFEINLNDSDFGKLILNDLTILSEIYNDSKKASFQKKVITLLIDEYDENVLYPFSEQVLIRITFERKLFKSKQTWLKTSGLAELLRLEYDNSDQPGAYITANLLGGLEHVVGRKSCECGSEACFFDLLNNAYTTFFNEDDLITNGELDEDKASIEFQKCWKLLNSKQKAVLRYLDELFGNTPLINLYLLTPSADFEEYIYKMTYNDQPDSEDDAFVRRSVSLVRFYIYI
jgi:hypothetical protein